MDNIIFNWLVNNTECYSNYEGHSNLIYKINFTFIGSDESTGVGYCDSVTSEIELSYDPNTNFTEYENLAEEQVLNWIQTALGQDKINEYKLTIYNNIEKQKNPPINIMTVPWNNF